MFRTEPSSRLSRAAPTDHGVVVTPCGHIPPFPEVEQARGVSFHYIASSREAVDEVMGKAVAARGGVVREAAASQYGYFGYFRYPDGYLWKVASSS
jgi:hypothetical protein